MHKIKFVIPSYKRLDIIESHTLKLLDDYNIPKNQIYIFVVAEELDAYKSKLAEYKNIILGEVGLANQRNFITNYFKEGDKLVNLDDDLKSFTQIKDNITQDSQSRTQHYITSRLTDEKDFKDFILKAFNTCTKYNAYLWGIHQTHNYPWMRDSITFDLSFIAGHFWGCINRHHDSLKITIDIKEDYERTIKYWLLDRIVVKLNYIASYNNTYNNPGGCNATGDRVEQSRISTNYLINTYPEYITARKHSITQSIVSSKMDEIIFKKVSSSTKIFIPLEKINKDDDIVKKLLESLQTTNLPIYKKRLNTGGDGITHCFGKYRVRKRMGLFESVNNARYPELYDAIKEFGEKYVIPTLGNYTSIQVNKNYKTKPHIDRNNVGNSYIIGLGDYGGGQLVINSYKHNIKYQPILFNGSEWKHSTEPFTGDRFSLVFFKQE